ncbi:hypothetical protein [Carnimonas bestiolae]|uniref:hypothetical protein n=1 Tax=Carnimonas bestiolae TaxID=3402172 RepID=UPI003EDBDAC7
MKYGWRWALRWGLGSGALVMSLFAQASPTDIPSAYLTAANRHGIPPAILYGVASAESVLQMDDRRRPWPWTLNVAGKGLRFDSRTDACQALVQALKTTRIVDVGIAQLNVRWQPHVFGPGKRFANPCDGLNPYANLDEAAKIIRGHYDQSGGDWMIAAGRYHYPAGGREAARYRRIVDREMRSLHAGDRLMVARHVRSSTHQPATAPTASRSTGPTLTWIVPDARADRTAATPSHSEDVTWVTPTARRNLIQEIATR